MRGIIFLLLAQFWSAPTDEASYRHTVESLFSAGQYDSVIIFHAHHHPFAATHDSTWWAIFLVAKSHHYLGDNVASDSVFSTIDPDKIHSSSIRSRVLLEHSLVLSEMGKFGFAENRMRLVRHYGEIEREDALAVRYHNYLGVWHFRQSRHFEALTELRKALHRLDGLDDDKQKSFVLSNLGIVCREIRQHGEALKYYQEALRLDSVRQDRQDLASDYVNLGNVFNEMNDLPQSRDHYEKSLLLFREVGDSAGITTVLLNLATVYESEKRFDEALDLQNQVLRLTQLQNDRHGEAHCLQNAAGNQMKSGDLHSAIKGFRSSLDIYRQLGRSRETVEVLVQIGDVFSRMQQMDSTEFYVHATFNELEHGGAGMSPWFVYHVLARIRQRQGHISAADSLFRLAEYHVNTVRYAAGEVNRYFLEGDHGEVFRDHIALLLRTGQTRESVERMRQLRAGMTSETRLGAPWESGDASVQITYFVHDTSSYVIVITERDTVVASLATETQLTGAAVEFLAMIRSSTADGSAIRNSGRRLFDLVISPVWDVLRKARSWRVEPDGVLAFVPLDALWTGEDFVANSHVVQLSLGCLEGVAPLVNSREGLFVSGGNPSNDLPFVLEEESMALSHTPLKWHTARNEKQLKSLSKMNMGVIHVAAHGVSNPERPEFSYLAVQSGDSVEDGAWTFDEIRSLKLKGCLVILSTCESAVGKDLRAAGVQGLARAFLLAGASAVVSTLWKVRDRTSVEFMRIFYEEWLLRNRSVAESLHGAKCALLARSQAPDPGLWAPYVMWTR